MLDTLQAFQSTDIILKNLQDLPSYCQTVWIKIRPKVGPDLDPNCLQRLSEGSRGERVKSIFYISYFYLLFQLIQQQ